MISAQRWYQIEWHRHGKGNWQRRPTLYPSRMHAETYARSRGMTPVEEASNGSKQAVFRILEVKESR